MEPEQQPCSNCGNNFPTDKIDLHEAYCARNMRKCQLCGIFIDVRETEQHQESHHQKQPCQFCKTEYSPEQLKQHTTQCLRRPKNCPFCETDVAWGEFEKHEGTCGTRTRPCVICQQPTILRDLASHEARCRDRLLNPPAAVDRHAERPTIAERVPPERPPPIPERMERLHHMPSQREAREVRPQRPDRDVSTNMLRHADSSQGPNDRSLSSNRLNEKVLPKKAAGRGYTSTIPPENIKKIVDILPISVKLTIKNKEQNREPLRNRN